MGQCSAVCRRYWKEATCQAVTTQWRRIPLPWFATPRETKHHWYVIMTCYWISILDILTPKNRNYVVIFSDWYHSGIILMSPKLRTSAKLHFFNFTKTSRSVSASPEWRPIRCWWTYFYFEVWAMSIDRLITNLVFPPRPIHNGNVCYRHTSLGSQGSTARWIDVIIFWTVFLSYFWELYSRGAI